MSTTLALLTPLNSRPKQTTCSTSFDAWRKTRGVWPRLTHEEIWNTAWDAAIETAMNYVKMTDATRP